MPGTTSDFPEINNNVVDLGPLLPSNEEFLRSKVLLQSMRSGKGTSGVDSEAEDVSGNLYEHMVALIRLLLEEQPAGALDRFEQLSWTVKREAGGGRGGSGEQTGLPADELQARAPAVMAPDPDFDQCQIEKTLFTHPLHKWDEPPDFLTPPPPEIQGFRLDGEELEKLENLSAVTMLVEQAAVGLNRTEMTRIWLAMRRLALKLPNVEKLRFWGKVLCTGSPPPYGKTQHQKQPTGYTSYYIAEAEVPETEAGEPPDPLSEVPGPWDNWRPERLQLGHISLRQVVSELSACLQGKRLPSIIEENSGSDTGEQGQEEQKRRSQESNQGEDETAIAENEPLPTTLTLEQLVQALTNLPRNKWRPPAPLPSELRGHGVNRWDYYVCQRLGDDQWSRLPQLRPEVIARARHVHRLFTGNLDAPVPCSPSLGMFPGVEAHLLRAQIARITAACWIAPSGMFEIDEEAELEEGDQPETLLPAEDFEPPELTDLLDSANWAHNRPFINRQGRCNWVTQKRALTIFKTSVQEGEILPSQAEDLLRITGGDIWAKSHARVNIINTLMRGEEIQKDTNSMLGIDFDLEDEDVAEEGEEDGVGTFDDEPEVSPGLLGPLDEDAPLLPIGRVGLNDGRLLDPPRNIKNRNISTMRPLPSWRTRASTSLLPANCAVAIVSNNRWPGAHALAKGSDLCNIYVGWGLKSLAASFIPPRLHNPLREFAEDTVPGSLAEIADPTPLEEEAVREAKEARRLARETAAEAAEEEEEGEAEGDDDED